ncbi:helix-turn-helix domain-containing protein [Streptomyces corynorhini]|uniref:XRE family transcriptional regulator n=1 Tax=Streptomyces corynorhini TaxID=2282652 RepID=A0A370B0M9_9ACTN|nr:helix-turn-helix transcriptional regulator [Streptomyces corynorhini]RDG34232.1 XRE family transcriptional regulator [Streptomyces corynorhini]
MSGASSTPLMSRVTLGRALRRLRDEVNHLTLAEVAAAIGCDISLLSRIELGKRNCSHEHFAKLMDLYKVSELERVGLAELHTATRERRQTWWSRYGEVITAEYERFLGFEAAASVVHEYQVGMIPGLLQTERYARAVIGAGFASLGPDQIDALVEVRDLRQRHRLLEADRPLVCHYVVTQAALEFQVGGVSGHREQLRHLLEQSERETVELKVIPYEKGEEGAQIAAFQVFQFADGDVPDIAFGESVAGNLTLDDPRDLRRLHRIFNNLSGAALDPDKSRDLITGIKNKED